MSEIPAPAADGGGETALRLQAERRLLDLADETLRAREAVSDAQLLRLARLESERQAVEDERASVWQLLGQAKASIHTLEDQLRRRGTADDAWLRPDPFLAQDQAQDQTEDQGRGTAS